MLRFSVISLVVVLFFLLACSKDTGTDDEDTIQPVPQGIVDKNGIISSEVLARDMHYSVYLPADYYETEESYPVLYLLHGMWGTYQDWVNNGMAAVTNSKIWSGEALKMIVIMPDGLDAFYCNNYNGGGLNYEDFFIHEFIPQIETKYRIKADGQHRAIAGLSMGGYGATFHAFKRPGMFSSCYSMSGALDMGSSAPDLKAILNAYSETELKDLPDFTMECGTEDGLVIAANEGFDAFLNAKNIDHTYIKRSGTHDWNFWMACLPKVIMDASKHFGD